MTHDQASELLAAHALDALDDSERAALEAHVAGCPRCQAELDSLRGVAGALGNLVESPPDSVWRSISSRLYGEGEVVPPPLVVPISARPTPRRWRLAVPVGLAAAVVAVLAIALSNANGHVSRLQGALKAGEVAAALNTPGHRLVDLASAEHAELMRFVLLPDGRGYLLTSHLPSLSARQTYQLWGIVKGKAISIGLMGRDPRFVTFTVSSTPRPATLAVTVEPAGGSQAPTGSIVASGAV